MNTWKDGFLYGGTLNRTSESVAAVNFWHLPGGYDVDNAQVIELYFDEKEGAECFYNKHKDNESMAHLEIY